MASRRKKKSKFSVQHHVMRIVFIIIGLFMLFAVVVPTGVIIYRYWSEAHPVEGDTNGDRKVDEDDDPTPPAE